MVIYPRNYTGNACWNLLLACLSKGGAARLMNLYQHYLRVIVVTQRLTPVPSYRYFYPSTAGPTSSCKC